MCTYAQDHPVRRPNFGAQGGNFEGGSIDFGLEKD